MGSLDTEFLKYFFNFSEILSPTLYIKSYADTGDAMVNQSGVTSYCSCRKERNAQRLMMSNSKDSELV